MRYEEAYRLPFFLADQHQEAHLATLVNMMLMGSEHQLTQQGAGMEAMLAQNLGWVVTQYELNVTRMPRVDEPLMLGTEATTYNKLMSYRKYWVATESGTRLAELLGAWVVMDLSSRKLVPIPPEVAQKAGAVADPSVHRFERLARLNEVHREGRYPVRYQDIDGNGHVNNSHYLEWMVDSLGGAFLNQHQLQSMTIKYAREVGSGSVPQALATIDGLTTFHEVQTDGQLNAQAKMTWQTRS